jgi:hypothetical protein
MKDAMDNYAHRLTDAEDEIELLRAALSQIRTVCSDNAAPTCKHQMALDFVYQVAAEALTGRKGDSDEAR